MSLINKLQPAFPTYKEEDGLGGVEYSGLRKREYFAGLAMQGLCTPHIPGSHNKNDHYEAQYKAEMAVRLADALLKELEK